MNDDFFKKIENFLEASEIPEVPIPRRLHSVYANGPFTHCVDCKQNLIEPPQFYEVQKVYKGREVIFEYALCNSCGEKLMKEYSKESLTNLQQYFIEHYWPSLDIEQCQLCHNDSFEEYSLMSMCRGSSMLALFVICHQCTESLEQLLSEKTRKVMGDFVDDKFPGVPAEFDLLPLLKI